jgi:radical SAM superfamily enzyme with C-terminal helix-hairpin-helix motif
MKQIRKIFPKKTKVEEPERIETYDRTIIYLKKFDGLPVIIGINEKSQIYVECIRDDGVFSVEEIQAEVERIVKWELSKVIKEDENAAI